MVARILPMGQDALLVEVPGESQHGAAAQVLSLVEALTSAADVPATDWRALVTEVVPAARTLLLRVDDPAALSAVAAGMSQLGRQLTATTRAVVSGQASTSRDAAGLGAEPLALEVTYDGPDLADVAAHTGLSEEDVVRAHTAAIYRVAFIGFAPGFPYLIGGDPRLRVPRRATPRTRVPAGSVGLAGEFSGVYPRSSPGGWQLLGRSDAVLWDVDRDPPALLRPGATVRFEVAQ